MPSRVYVIRSDVNRSTTTSICNLFIMSHWYHVRLPAAVFVRRWLLWLLVRAAIFNIAKLHNWWTTTYSKLRSWTVTRADMSPFWVNTSAKQANFEFFTYISSMSSTPRCRGQSDARMSHSSGRVYMGCQASNFLLRPTIYSKCHVNATDATRRQRTHGDILSM